MSVVIPPVPTLKKIASYALNFFFFILLGHSFYTTLFVLDGSANDFTAGVASAWTIIILNVFLSFPLWISRQIFYTKKVTLRRLVTSLVPFMFPLFLLPIILLILGSYAGGLSTLVVCILFAVSKVRNVLTAKNVSFVLNYALVFVSLIIAFYIDELLQMNAQYMLVLSDTLSKLPSNQHFEVSPGATINVHLLIFYVFIVLSSTIDFLKQWGMRRNAGEAKP